MVTSLRPTPVRFLLWLALISLSLIQCKKGDDVPALTVPLFDASVLPISSNITGASASVASIIKSNGGNPIVQHGHVWSKTSALPVLTDTKTELGATTGPFPFSFVDQLNNLDNNTMYYVRAYATNSVGTAYGPVVQIKTATLPLLPNAPIVGLVLTRAASVSCTNVSENNGGSIVQQGFVWSKTTDTPTPTLTNNKRELGPASGSAPFSLTALLADLTPGTAYSVRAFATNTNGTAYSPAVTVQSVVEIPNATADKPQGRSTGDPHFVTFDKVAYAFRGAGEFVVVKSTVDKFEVQARQQEIKSLSSDGSVSFTTGLAINTGNDVVCIYPPGQIYVNKILLGTTFAAQNLSNGGQLSKSDNTITVRNSQGDNVRVVLYDTSLDYYVQPAASRAGKLTGLMGNFDGNNKNDVTLPNGTAVITDYANLYPAYANGWRIDTPASNFVYTSGQTTATFTDSTFPKKDVTISTSQRSQAEQTCRTKGVTDPVLLEECITDVAVTGNTTLADRTFAVQSAAYPATAITIGNFADPNAPLAKLTNATIAYGGIDLVYPASNSSAIMKLGRTLDLTGGFECSFEVSGNVGQRIFLQLNLPNDRGYSYIGLFTDPKLSSPVSLYDFDATPTIQATGKTLFDGRLHTVKITAQPGTNNQGTTTQISLDGTLLYQCKNAKNTATVFGYFNSVSIGAFDNPSGPGQYHIQNLSFKTY